VTHYILAGLLGGFISGTILIAQHYLIDRKTLKRQHAYIIGVLGLDTGFVVFVLAAGLPPGALIGAAIVEAIAGATVLLAYKNDEHDGDKGQLQEALDQAEALRKELAEAKAIIEGQREIIVSGPVKWGQLVEMFVPYLNARNALETALVHFNTGDRNYYKLAEQAGKEVPDKVKRMNAARAAKREATQNDKSGQ
jgi:hypothetical protein